MSVDLLETVAVINEDFSKIICAKDIDKNKDPKEIEADKFASYFIAPYYSLKKTYEEYDNAALFDYDLNDVEFKRNIEFCDQLNNANKPSKRKNGKYTYHSFSNVNFDL